MNTYIARKLSMHKRVNVWAVAFSTPYSDAVAVRLIDLAHNRSRPNPLPDVEAIQKILAIAIGLGQDDFEVVEILDVCPVASRPELRA